MSIVRVRKRENPFVQIDRTVFEDHSLSWKAKGILGYLLSKPDNWQIYIADLEKKAKDGRDSVRTGLRELEENGYVRKVRTRGTNGKFAGWEYQVFETPMISEVTTDGKTEIGKSDFGESDFGKSNTSNNYLSNKEESNNENNLVVVEEKASQLYQKYFGPLSPKVMTSIMYWIREISDELVSEAITRAVQKGKDWDYTVGILREWQQHKLRTITDVELYEEQWRQKKEEVNNHEVHKHRRGVSRSAKEGSKSYEQVLREAEAARRAWGGS
ncbi:DnaD domain protein [Anoxybacteroides rupiense]|jgi:DnaD/phage-associated family protein|uniref:DnaD domain protein n=1 Tax=Anoxybacteroides rupiense TaxID=311460 RepID=UPI00366FBE94